MGRNNKSYFLDLHQQMYNRLVSMQNFGKSKKEAMKNGSDKDKIFSVATYKTYYKHCNYFIKWVNEKYPQCTTLKSARKYVPEWLDSRAAQKLSNWTLQTEAKSLGKLYGITPTDKDYWDPPQRHREDIKRSRIDTESDKHFSRTNNDELIKFCQGTGLRRRELEELRGKDLLAKNEIEREISNLENRVRTEMEDKKLDILRDTRLFNSENYIFIRNGKGGRMRISPIMGSNADQIVERIKNTPQDDKVWQHVPQHADIHGYRSDYATAMYREYARDIKDIPYDKINKGSGHAYQSEVYHGRKDERGRELDKRAMYICSKALGHNRISVVAENYLRGL